MLYFNMYMYKRQIGYQKGTFNTGCIFSFTLLKRKTTAFYFKIKWYELWVSSNEHKWHFLTSLKTSYSKESISSCLLYNFITVFLWDSFFSIILGAHLMMPWRYSSKWLKVKVNATSKENFQTTLLILLRVYRNSGVKVKNCAISLETFKYK